MNKLMTIAELQSRTEAELRGLFRQATLALALTAHNTPERRNSLATLENISRTIALAPGRGL
ncbi:MAG: hypothetical protein IPK66_03355 [Rhodospirillales bacterium]|nr:hypothetical protein [Rhodospirillales bacterium]